MCQFLQLQSHCKNLELPHCQDPIILKTLILKFTIIVSTNMWKGERRQGKVSLKKEKQAFNFFQRKDKFMQCAPSLH